MGRQATQTFRTTANARWADNRRRAVERMTEGRTRMEVPAGTERDDDVVVVANVEDPDEPGTFVSVVRRLDDPAHTTDSDCQVDPETGACFDCGVDHTDQCSSCGGHAFHNDGCPEVT